MYVKLFARITESSLMEEEIAVRYTFVMLLALADPSGLVVGTDIAISRRLNMPTKLFAKCVKSLQHPDPDSNSKESDGRRLIPSESERGYQIINYAKYRDLKSEDERRAYMRDYMRDYRAGKPSVNNVNSGKPELAKLTQAEGDSDLKAEGEGDGNGGNAEVRVPPDALSTSERQQATTTPEPAETPSMAEAVDYADRIGLVAWKAEMWWREMEAVGWQFKGQRVQKWRPLLTRVKTYWESDGRPMTPPGRPVKKGDKPPMTFMP